MDLNFMRFYLSGPFSSSKKRFSHIYGAYHTDAAPVLYYMEKHPWLEENTGDAVHGEAVLAFSVILKRCKV